MASVVLEVVTTDTLFTSKVVDTLQALIAMEVRAIVALIVTNLIVLLLALLFAKRHKGRDQKDASNNQGHDCKSQQVFDPDISFLLNPLLKVDSLIVVASFSDHFEEDPSDVGDGHPENSDVQSVIWFVHHRLVVVVKHKQWDLMKQQLLAKTDIQIVCLNFSELSES